ncbi:MAG: hypothetical protein A2Z44_05585 [Betaproteobacteria bacterium RBG_19FT_COMBO_58_11]|nr:MAG: hypothetical protein A2Z44_05585 [Betaproteobacteria bacterium RBG_19FT_COMBO_58_11]
MARWGFVQYLRHLHAWRMELIHLFQMESLFIHKVLRFGFFRMRVLMWICRRQRRPLLFRYCSSHSMAL